MPKCILIIFLVLSVGFDFFAQTSKSLGIHYENKLGLLLVHSTKMSHLPKQFVHGSEIGIQRIVSGKKMWHRLYSQPKIGLSCYWGNLGNDVILGKVFGGYAFIELPLIRSNKHLFSVRIGNGIGRVSKVFSVNDNPLNSAISSEINSMFQFSLMYNYSFKKFDFGLGSDFLHLSNAAIKSPNLGLNIPSLKLRMAYSYSTKLRSIELKNEVVQSDKAIPKNRFLAILFGSYKQLYENPGVSYPVYGATLSYQRIGSSLRGWEYGVDVNRNGSDIQLLYNQGVETKKIVKYGVYGAYIVQLDKFQMLAGMGVYCYDPHRLNGLFYHRVALRYIVYNHLTLNLGLKSHWANADYAEFGIGFCL